MGVLNELTWNVNAYHFVYLCRCVINNDGFFVCLFVLHVMPWKWQSQNLTRALQESDPIYLQKADEKMQSSHEPEVHNFQPLLEQTTRQVTLTPNPNPRVGVSSTGRGRPAKTWLSISLKMAPPRACFGPSVVYPYSNPNPGIEGKCRNTRPHFENVPEMWEHRS